ncbi:hypothetical protein AB0G73_37725 [Streptomyces sp. NPDC020719]|uniref:hypothetical protein n=1 Tax=Streptomyces sp. NPDC020719 TaxID=3154896 RepID=UPI0033D47C6A
MGSLRNPVGPLPSSIYWRRRAVALSLLALAVILILWAVSSGGSGGSKGTSNDKGAHPAPSITPGPGSSGPAISTAPGGRDESSAAGGTGGGGSGSGGSGSSAGGTGGSDGSGNGGTDAGGSGSGGSGGSGGSVGHQVPAGSSLPTCAPGQLKLSVRSLKNAYAPGEKPKLELALQNTVASTCKADLGPANAVLVVTDSTDAKVWASDDCPIGSGSVLFQVPGSSTITHTVEWDRTRSAAHCATPGPGAVGAGTYLAEVKLPGLPVARAPFSLSRD